MCQIPAPPAPAPAPAVACFLTGTEIATAVGPVPVESLIEGAILVTNTGEMASLRWVGHRTIDVTADHDPESTYPICIQAGALADNVPSSDLYVSPEHAMFIAGVLIPAFKLVNGSTVRRVKDCKNITYYHLECDRHVILIANGAYAESLFDLGYRTFDNREPTAKVGDILDLTELRRRLAAPAAKWEAVKAITQEVNARADAAARSAEIERRSESAA